MIFKIGLVVVVCIAAASDAAVLSRELDKRQNNVAPTVKLLNKRLGQKLGKDVILQCTVTAYPQYIVFWTEESRGILTNSGKYHIDIWKEDDYTMVANVRIKHLSEDDFGEYTCVASNLMGRDRKTMTLYQTGLSPRPPVTPPSIPVYTTPTITFRTGGNYTQNPEEPYYVDQVSEEPYYMDQVSNKSLEPTEQAGASELGIESVYSGAEGFQDNFRAFFTALGQVLKEYCGDNKKAMLPVLEAIPAEVLKEGLINVLEATSRLIEKLAVVIRERNPLHPKKSPYELSNVITGRELDELKRKFVGAEIMTLSIWGENVGKMIGAVDDRLVDMVGTLAEKMEGAAGNLQLHMVGVIRQVPASMLKHSLLKVFRGED